MPALPARVARLRSRHLLAAAALLVTAAPAAAQSYDRPYGRPYVQPYIDLDLNAYSQPGPADYNAPPVALPPQDVEPMLRSMGMSNVGRVRAGSNIYAVDATDPRGMRQRVRIDAMSGRIISMIPIGPDASATGYGAPPPGNGGWNPPPAALNVPSGMGGVVGRQVAPQVAQPLALPAQPPLPPTRQPEFAAVPPAGQGPMAPSAVPQGPDTDDSVDEVDTGPGAYNPPSSPPPTTLPANPPAAAAPAPAQAPAPAVANGPIRVIPGVAVPPGTAPSGAAAGVGTGVGTGAPDGSAGTASVIARDGGGTTPAPAP
ncbi:hypothetical protein AncyloWKF20_11455 [Ancylobacter sp. WKF20]|uniref:hypothetical protein n=1 Tax=Ancylobacter sp. WKF20 TaxID=3039801 RepID=UPI002434482F|nr:hypothetical protein [Ancylobacter sp. WKF20]WGD28435.1 hypothetical protein AncyloWKF20_11455 [Ancylobacter sp. WKF20]